MPTQLCVLRLVTMSTILCLLLFLFGFVSVAQSACPSDAQKSAMYGIWNHQKPKLTALTTFLALGDLSVLCDFSLATQSLIVGIDDCLDVQLLNSIADSYLLPFVLTNSFTDSDSEKAYTTWHALGVSEPPDPHCVSLFMYNYAKIVNQILRLQPQARASTMSELLAMFDIIFFDNLVPFTISENRHVAVTDRDKCGGGYQWLLDSTTTIAAWIKTQSLSPTSETIFSISSGHFVLEVLNGYLNAQVAVSPSGNGVNGVTYTVSSAKKVNDGQWHHVAMTYEGKNRNTTIVYVDGVKAGQLNGTGGPFLHRPPTTAQIGGYETSSKKCCYFNGAIADVRLWTTALTPADILTLSKCSSYNNTACNTFSELLGAWPLQDVSGYDNLQKNYLDDVRVQAEAVMPGPVNLTLSKAVVFSGSDIIGWPNFKLHNKHTAVLRAKSNGYLRNRADDSEWWCNGLSTVDISLLGATAELLAAVNTDPQITTEFLTPQLIQELEQYLTLGINTVASHMNVTTLRDFNNSSVNGLVFEQGWWKTHTSFKWAGTTQRPTTDVPAIADTVSITTATFSSFLPFLASLEKHRENVTKASFPTAQTMQQLANQFLFGIFNKNFSFPLLANYMDGTNGWHDWDPLNQNGFGPNDMSTFLVLGSFGLLSRYDSRVSSVMDGVWNLLIASNPTFTNFRDSYYGKSYEDGIHQGSLALNYETSLDFLNFLSLYRPSAKFQVPASSDQSTTNITDNGSENTSSGTQVWMIAVIAGVGGGFLLLVVVVGCVVFAVKKRRANKRNSDEIPMTDIGKLNNKTEDGNINDNIHNYRALASLNDSHGGGSGATSNTEYGPIPPAPSALAGSQYKKEKVAWEIPYSELQFIAKIGEGAFGIVWQGIWRKEKVAVKELKNMNAAIIDEFYAEADLMMRMRPHANVVMLKGICTNPYLIVTEFMAKGNLCNYLKSLPGPLPHQQIVHLLKGIASGLHWLHCEQVVHRDLATRNILLSDDLTPKITDFGMSRFCDEDKTNVTVSNVGPIPWMAPESLSDRVYNHKTDVYSFGIVIVELVKRASPYSDSGLTLVQIADRVMHQNLRPNLPVDTPTDLIKLLERCTQQNPSARPHSQELIDLLEQMAT